MSQESNTIVEFLAKKGGGKKRERKISPSPSPLPKKKKKKERRKGLNERGETCTTISSPAAGSRETENFYMAQPGFPAAVGNLISAFTVSCLETDVRPAVRL